ncbi:MAG: hypothetical protein MZV70_18935 [Desulfobacterales bacterium]|nr:hypothetical protein [Desulfobacterales bacterium]
MLHDMPEVLELKCRQDPDFRCVPAQGRGSRLERRKPPELHLGRASTTSVSSWPELQPRVPGAGSLQPARCSRAIIYAHAAAAVRNTWKLLLFPELSNGFEPFGPDSFVAEDLRIAFPEDVAPYLGSRQASGALERASEKAGCAVHRPGLAVDRRLPALRRNELETARRDDALVQLALFALIARGRQRLFHVQPQRRVRPLSGADRLPASIFPALALISRDPGAQRSAGAPVLRPSPFRFLDLSPRFR